MAVNQEKIKELLGQNLPIHVVASAVGCEDSYITQLLSDADFSAEVTQLRMLALTEYTRRDRNIDAIEDKLISRLEEQVDYMRKPNDILRAFQVLNAAKRRGVGSETNLTVNQTIVTLQIPDRVVKKVTINQQGEVVQVGDQTLVTMPTPQLLKRLGEGEDGERYKKVSNHLLTTDGAKGISSSE